jgi:hypothetical protein
MKSMIKQLQGEELFIGIDLHKRRWHVTIRTADVEIFSNSIAGRWQEKTRQPLFLMTKNRDWNPSNAMDPNPFLYPTYQLNDSIPAISSVNRSAE